MDFLVARTLCRNDNGFSATPNPELSDEKTRSVAAYRNSLRGGKWRNLLFRLGRAEDVVEPGEGCGTSHKRLANIGHVSRLFAVVYRFAIALYTTETVS